MKNMWILANSDTYYILKMNVYEGTKCYKLSGHGVGYDIIEVRLIQIWLMLTYITLDIYFMDDLFTV